MPEVFIHTNNQQLIGALVSTYTLRDKSKEPDNFKIRILRLEEMPELWKREGQTYLRKGKRATWRNRDLQSFSPLRKAVPQLMGYQGRALVIDPDVFAIQDVLELLNMDMRGAAIRCRFIKEGYKNNQNRFYASSVMLLDCARLSHWKWNEQIEEMFNHERDYGPWIGLLEEDEGSIAEIGEEWNSFDKLTEDTKLLHMTERLTQPWKSGLPIDFDMTTAKVTKKGMFAFLIRKIRNKEYGTTYQKHPDPRLEGFFFKSLGEMLTKGLIGTHIIDEAIEKNFIRHDSYELIRNCGCHLESGMLVRGKYEEDFDIESLSDVPWED